MRWSKTYEKNIITPSSYSFLSTLTGLGLIPPRSCLQLTVPGPLGLVYTYGVGEGDVGTCTRGGGAVARAVGILGLADIVEPCSLGASFGA